MSRELKRVPLDFDWPQGEIWEGYEPPETRGCPDCDGHGDTRAGRLLDQIAHLIMIAGDSAERGELHPWLEMFPYSPDDPPGEDMVELADGLAGRSSTVLGHDAIDRGQAARKIIEAAGLEPDTWGRCENCDGRGTHPDDQEMLDAWERTDPPEGEGYQLWEMVSEGSPVTPVFEAVEGLAGYLAENPPGAVYEGEGLTADDWIDMLAEFDGWLPTGVLTMPSEGEA